MGLEVIGAGFGRTGTLSLKRALERLGYERCHHMVEVARSREQVAAWHAVALGAPPDWDRLFEGYRAACDWPSCDHVEALADHYPDALVVLTVRDEERWYASVAETVYAASNALPRVLALLVPRWGRFNRMVAAAIWEGTFAGRFEEPDVAKRIFRDHIARVKERVPRDRLLVFDVAEGWGPLCHFLGCPEPDEPFPHLNDAVSIKRGLRALRILGWLLPLLTATLLAWAFM